MIFRVMILLFLGVFPVFAENWLQEGLRAMRENRSEEALPLLQKAASIDENELALYYLALVLQRLGRWDEAKSAFQRCIALSGPFLGKASYGMGNLLLSQGRYKEAGQFYTEALSAHSSDLPRADIYLNRANAFAFQEIYRSAVEDYRNFLHLASSSPKREKVERMIQLLLRLEDVKQKEKALARRQERLERERARQRFFREGVRSLLDEASGGEEFMRGGNEQLETREGISDIEE